MTQHKRQRPDAAPKPDNHKVRKEGQVDKAVEQTFPASDPTATGRETSNEKPARPTDRQAPVISKEDIERAKRGHRSR